MKRKIVLPNLVAFAALMASYSLSAQEAAKIAKAYHEAEAGNIVADFRQFLSLPNVASDHADMQANAAFRLVWQGALCALIKQQALCSNAFGIHDLMFIK